VVLVPVAFLRHPSVAGGAVLAGAAVAYGGIAVAVFLAGLRRYRHG
jgi:hypothetical protein